MLINTFSNTRKPAISSEKRVLNFTSNAFMHDQKAVQFNTKLQFFTSKIAVSTSHEFLCTFEYRDKIAQRQSAVFARSAT